METFFLEGEEIVNDKQSLVKLSPLVGYSISLPIIFSFNMMINDGVGERENSYFLLNYHTVISVIFISSLQIFF